MKANPYTSTRSVVSLLPVARTESVAGSTVDLSQYKNYHRTAKVVVLAGVTTNGTHTLKVEESDNDSDWTDVPANRLFGTLPAVTTATDDRVLEQGVITEKRYIRAYVTVTGSPAQGGIYGAVFELGGARREPVARS